MNLLDKLKTYLQSTFAVVSYVLGLLLFVMTGAFLYEKSRKNSAEAVADNQKMLDKLNNLEEKKAKNDGLLESEAQKREEIKEQVTNEEAQASNDSSPSDFFNKRK